MTKKPTTLDDIFDEVERENEARTAQEIAEEQTPEGLARKEAERRAQIEKDIRQGLRDADGNWIEQPEVDGEDQDDEDEGDDDDDAA